MEHGDGANSSFSKKQEHDAGAVCSSDTLGKSTMLSIGDRWDLNTCKASFRSPLMYVGRG